MRIVRYYLWCLLILYACDLTAVCNNCSKRKFLMSQINTDAQFIHQLFKSLAIRASLGEAKQLAEISFSIAEKKEKKEATLRTLGGCKDCSL